MRSFAVALLLLAFTLSCQHKENNTVNTSTPRHQTENSDSIESAEDVGADTRVDKSTENMAANYSMVLTSNALQIVDMETGSSSEIAFEKPLDEMVELSSKVLGMKPSHVGINSECGAGPLQMASWSNGLTLVFQKKKLKNTGTEKDWQFAGWYMGVVPKPSKSLTTMAGVGIGSTRAEMESAYVIEVSETSLGHEFSTTAGLYGIFDGAGQEAKITSLWSGLSCNFR